MKNIEKYTNSKDALDAYNSLAFKTVSFDEWLKREYEEPRVPTLLEAAQEVVKTWYEKIPEGSIARVEQSIVRLASTIDREKCKPVRNFDTYKTANEANNGFREMCNGIQKCEDCRFRHVNCEIAWLYEKAGKDKSHE